MSRHMQFKAEVKELLNMMINSIYSNKEIFLRELIANAADALDKRRFLALTRPELASEGEIRITADEAACTLAISDNGIGMTKDELVENLGTIAHSGSRGFLAELKKAQEENPATAPELIGQFGVGFYAAFMAADKVSVLTKKAGEDQAYLWESEGVDTFTVTEAEKDAPGTTVTLHLKDDFKNYLEYWTVSSVVRKYSDFIEYPIRMAHKTKDKDGKDVIEDDTLNTMKAIWLRPESEVTDDEYKSFYSHLSGDYEAPLKRIVFSAEGASEFKALLFLAAKLPFQYQFGVRNKKTLSLYVKRVFITDECPGLLPDYMNGFVSGVVDSSDLPLNISRETLQDNPQIKRISKAIVKRVFSELQTMMEKDRATYEKFYAEFSRLIKEGAYSDWENREKLQNLLLFETMNGEPGKLVSLKEYSDAMPPTQKAIYFITGENRAAVEHSPQLELFRQQKLDVLYLLDPVDEFVINGIGKYAEKDIVSVSKSDLKLDEPVQKELEKKTQEAAEQNKSLLEFLKKTLENRVKDVRFSARLTESVCCLVGDEADPSVNMQRLMKAMKQEAPEVKRILELNPDAPLIRAMAKKYEAEPGSAVLTDYAAMLYDQALLCEGSELPDPAAFARRTAKLMTDGLTKN